MIKKPKAPIKPKEPKPPQVPRKTILKNESFWIDEGTTVAYLTSKLITLGVHLDKATFGTHVSTPHYYDDQPVLELCVHWSKEIPNELLETQTIAFENKFKKYSEALKIYDVAMDQYRKDLLKHEEEMASHVIEKLKTKLEQKKSYLEKETKRLKIDAVEEINDLTNQLQSMLKKYA